MKVGGLRAGDPGRLIGQRGQIADDAERRCCTTRAEAEFSLSPSGSGDAHDLGLSEGREAIHQGDAGVDLGGLAVGVS